MAAITGISANRLATVSRRRLMALAGGAALSQWLQKSALAASFGVGDGEISVISDGMLTLPLSFVLPDTPEAEIEALFKANGMSMDSLTPDCNVTLLRKGERLILFDVGSGSNFMPTAGKLSEGLAEAGIDPAEVTDVIFTHAHPDHLWGVLDDFDEPLFTNAQHMMGKAEFDFWIDPAAADTLDEGRKVFAAGALRRLQVLEDRLLTFDADTEILPGIHAHASFGHTPGHMAFELRQGNAACMIVGDAIGNGHVAFAAPGLVAGADQDPETGISTRQALLDRLAVSQMPMIGYHLPDGGAGRVERADGAYRFTAEL